jgi:hypothetical protein
MTENKRRRGRPLERPGGKRIGFYVSADDHEWLTALPNRSAWLAEQVEKERRPPDTGAQSGADTHSEQG